MRAFGLLVLILGCVFAFSSSTHAAAPLVQDAAAEKDPSQLGSLLRVPPSAGFYFATMNHEAMVEAVTESNAWRAIKKSEVARGMKSAYRRGRTKGYAEYNEENPVAQYLKFYGETFDNFIVKSGWEITRQVIGNEVFIYVDNDMAEFIEVTRNAQKEAYELMASELNFEDLESQDVSEEMRMLLVTRMLKQLTDTTCPTMIMGSRLEDPEGFKGMLELLESGAEAGMNELPPELEFLRDGWKVIDEKDSYFLTFNLELADLPLDEMLAEVDDAELVSAVEEFVLNKRGSVAIGIVDNLLLMGVASDAKKLIEFGSEDKLIDLPRLARLNESIQKNEAITGVYYISEEYAKAQFSFADAMDVYMPLIEKGIVAGFSQGAEFSEADGELFAKQFSKDMGEMATDLKSIWPKTSFGYGFTKLGDDGMSGHVFSGADHPALDSSKPLELTKHASPETVLFAVQRPRKLGDQYAIVSKWSSKLYAYIKDYGLEQAFKEMERAAGDAAEAAEADTPDLLEEPKSAQETQAENEAKRKLAYEAIEEFEAFASRFDRTTRERLLPAIDGQEAGLFVELVEGPKSWHPELPETATPQPLPLPALMMGHNNQSDVVLAFEEYYGQVKQLYSSLQAKVSEEDLTANMEWNLNLEKTESDSGTLFQLSVPSELELDSSVRPGMLISKDRIVISLLEKQAVALSKPRTSSLFGPAAETEPSSGAFFYDNRAMMNGIETWSTVAREKAKEAADSNDVAYDLTQYEAERDTLQFTEAQLSDYFEKYWDLGGCWKGLSARSYSHQGGVALDFLFKFNDLEPVE